MVLNFGGTSSGLFPHSDLSGDGMGAEPDRKVIYNDVGTGNVAPGTVIKQDIATSGKIYNNDTAHGTFTDRTATYNPTYSFTGADLIAADIAESSPLWVSWESHNGTNPAEQGYQYITHPAAGNLLTTNGRANFAGYVAHSNTSMSIGEWTSASNFDFYDRSGNAPIETGFIRYLNIYGFNKNLKTENWHFKLGQTLDDGESAFNGAVLLAQATLITVLGGKMVETIRVK